MLLLVIADIINCLTVASLRPQFWNWLAKLIIDGGIEMGGEALDEVEHVEVLLCFAGFDKSMAPLSISLLLLLFNSIAFEVVLLLKSKAI